MYRLIIPRAIFSQLALLDEGAEGILICTQTKHLRYVVQVRTPIVFIVLIVVLV
jgi:hypothetical protein